jgi:NAD(P)-dependent dehydrogenase (short-subunit alcohol dehydrogenase family)
MTKHEQTVLITGAASGIGEAIARALAGREYRVFGTSRRPDSVERRPGIEMLALDVRDPDSVRRCIQEVIERAGAIDVLINNAGYALMGGVEESSEAEIAAQFDTNFYGVVRLTQAVLPHMRARGITPSQGDIFQPEILGKVQRITAALLETPGAPKVSKNFTHLSG